MWLGINGEVAWTLDGHYYLGCGNRGGREREVVYWVDNVDVMAFDESQITCPKNGLNPKWGGAMPNAQPTGRASDRNNQGDR